MVESHHCYDHTDDYRRIVSSNFAAKMNELRIENSINIQDITEKINAEKINLRT